MVKRLFLLLLLWGIGYVGLCKNRVCQPDTVKVEFPLIFQLPNSAWHLVVNKQPSEYLFKREPIQDSKGNQVIPAIAIYAEDATNYQGDVSIFAGRKMQAFTDNGVKNQEMLIWQDKGYPLSIRNAVFEKGTYTSAGLDHIIYLIYIIDKHNKGIQIYMDMTAELEPKYGQEFWTTIKSLRETK